MCIFRAQVMLVSPCFETFLPFSCVTRRSPLWGIVMRGVLLSCESCSDHVVCPRPHTESAHSPLQPHNWPGLFLLLEVFVIDLNVVRRRFCDTFVVAAQCSIIHRIWIPQLNTPPVSFLYQPMFFLELLQGRFRKKIVGCYLFNCCPLKVPSMKILG